LLRLSDQHEQKKPGRYERVSNATIQYMNLLIVFLAQHKAPEVGRVLLESTLGMLSCNKGPKEFLNVEMEQTSSKKRSHLLSAGTNEERAFLRRFSGWLSG